MSSDNTSVTLNTPIEDQAQKEEIFAIKPKNVEEKTAVEGENVENSNIESKHLEENTALEGKDVEDLNIEPKILEEKATLEGENVDDSNVEPKNLEEKAMLGENVKDSNIEPKNLKEKATLEGGNVEDSNVEPKNLEEKAMLGQNVKDSKIEPKSLEEKAALEDENVEDANSINTSEDSGVEAEALVSETQNITQEEIEAEAMSNKTQSTAQEKIPPTKSDANPESDEPKCDNCSTVDIENITNNLAEKVNIGSTDSCNDSTTEETKCDTTDINKTNNENAAAEAAASPQKLINKVQQLSISDTDQQNAGSKKSAVIVKQQTESLKNLMAYSSSSSEDSEDDEEEEEEKTENWQIRIVSDSDTDSGSSDSDDSDDTEETSSSDDDKDDDAGSEPKKAKLKDLPKPDPPITDDFALKIYSENNVEDLPPVRDVSNLDINMEKEEFLHMGNIEAIIETLITVGAFPGIPAYDLDTCFFIEDKTQKRPLGAVYDVIGPVSSPLYCIRFQYPADIAKLNVKKGTKVFCAPQSKYTRYVFVKELMKHKGSDASWVDDIEIPPEIAAELSDDECDPDSEEPRKPQKRKHNSQERHKKFEENMNRSNALNSHAHRVVQGQRHVPRISHHNDQVQRVLFNDIAQNRRMPAPFDPTVPPPGFHSFPRFRSHGFKWPAPASALRTPRCHLFGQNQSHYNSYTSNDTSQGPGPSSHPY